MSGHGHRPASSRASRRFDGVLAAFGLVLLVAALVWLVVLIGDGRAGVSSSPQTVLQTAVPADIEPEAMLEDEDFGVALPGRALRRIVQMLQWREVASVPLAADDEVVVDQGEYQLIWSERMIDSSAFASAQGHVNPPAPPYRSRSLGAGAAAWNDADARAWRAVSPGPVALPENLAAVFRADGEWLLTAAPGDLPAPGDLRVRFEVLPDSAAAQQSGLPDTPPAAAPASEDPLDTALRWIARVAALVMAMLGAGLALRGVSRLSRPESALGRLRSGALLAISAWIAVGVALLAALIVRVI